MPLRRQAGFGTCSVPPALRISPSLDLPSLPHVHGRGAHSPPSPGHQHRDVTAPCPWFLLRPPHSAKQPRGVKVTVQLLHHTGHSLGARCSRMFRHHTHVSWKVRLYGASGMGGRGAGEMELEPQPRPCVWGPGRCSGDLRSCLQPGSGLLGREKIPHAVRAAVCPETL